jgi:hypothetical protein
MFGHALPTHTYLSVGATLHKSKSIDIYDYFIYEGYLQSDPQGSIVQESYHTYIPWPRRKCINENHQVSTYISHLIILIWA